MANICQTSTSSATLSLVVISAEFIGIQQNSSGLMAIMYLINCVFNYEVTV